MKILFFSPFFYPKTGGLETVALYLSEGLQRMGHEIRLINYTSLNGEDELHVDFLILRNPSEIDFFKSFNWCDIFIQHNISLKGIWPLLIFPKKKWMVLHHLTYYNHDKITLIENLKRQLSRLSYNISCSNYVNLTLPKKGSVLYNAYDEDTFKDLNLSRNELSLIFVGRLVSDKGCNLLIEALAKIKQLSELNRVKLSIIGDGPERSNLELQIERLDLKSNVQFKGILKGEELALELNKNKIIVVPSKWKEPFGIVALEGIACGCIPIYPDEGGLIEACGKLGVGFKRNNVNDLGIKIIDALNNYEHYRFQLVKESANHLKNFTKKTIVENFDKLLRQYVQN